MAERPAYSAVLAEQLRDKVLPFCTRRDSILLLIGKMARPHGWDCQEKIPTLNEIVPYTDFFFVAPTAYDKRLSPNDNDWGAAEHVESIITTLDSVSRVDHDTLKAAFEKLVADTGLALGQYASDASSR